MAFLPYIKYPNFRGLITFDVLPHSRITGPCGIADAAMDLFRKVDPNWLNRTMDKVFVGFSSGATVGLRHFEYEQDEINSKALQANLTDEAQQFTERQVVYLRGRNR